MFLRPKPKFRVGQLTEYTTEEKPEARYLLINNTRWVRPNGTKNKRWVYDGTLLKIEEGRIVVSTYGSCALEENMTAIDGVT